MNNNITVSYIGTDPSVSDHLERLALELGWESKVLPLSVNPFETEAPGSDVMLVDLDAGPLFFDPLSGAANQQNMPLILLSSSHDESLYLQHRKMAPFGYLVKPFSKLQLRSLVESSIFYLESDNKALRLLQSWREEEELHSSFFIKNNHKLIKVKQYDILAVMADGNYCVIITPQRRHAVKISLRRIKQKLSNLLFKQIHRNYIIQLPKVESVDLSTGEVFLGGESYPIGGSYRQQFLDYLDRI